MSHGIPGQALNADNSLTRARRPLSQHIVLSPEKPAPAAQAAVAATYQCIGPRTLSGGHTQRRRSAASWMRHTDTYTLAIHSTPSTGKSALPVHHPRCDKELGREVPGAPAPSTTPPVPPSVLSPLKRGPPLRPPPPSSPRTRRGRTPCKWRETGCAAELNCFATGDLHAVSDG